ncbi:hypothetical protein ES705_26878 [subsurface metagenome]
MLRSSAPEIIMPGFDINRLLEEDEAVKGMDIPYRFGKGFDVNYSFADGKWTNVDSGRVWLLRITSPGAYSLNFVMDELYIPEGAKLYIFSDDGSMVYGPVTSKQNLKKGLFITDLVKGESVILYLFERLNKKESSKLRITRVIHAYKDVYAGLFESGKGLGSSEWCEEDVACYPDWSIESDAVARTLVGGGNYFCSGSLINNTAQDFRAYFLSAFHCIDIDKSGDIDTDEYNDGEDWVFRFRYKMTTCEGSQVASYFTYNNDDIIAAWNTTDFALVELHNSPLSHQNVSFLGWDNTGATPTEGTTIHHPQGDVMKLSFDDDPLQSISWFDGPEDTHWRADFDIGAVEYGSSGSPLFDQNKRVVGQLHGNQNNAYPILSFCEQHLGEYGRFDVSWTGGGTETTRLIDWLDECETGALTMNTIPSAYVSGPDIVCTSNSTFTLHNRPPGTTVNWTKSSNLSYVSGQSTDNYTVKATPSAAGPGWVQATITTDCGDATIRENIFWVGKPAQPTILGPDEVTCYFPEWYFINSESIQWGDFQWSTDYALRIIGTTTGHKALIEGLEEGYGQIFCEVTNTCGSTENRLVVWIDCWRFRMSPNPADDYVEISIDESKLAENKIDVYEVRIYNVMNKMVYNVKTSKPTLQINTRQFINGVYYVHFIFNGKLQVEQLVISH